MKILIATPLFPPDIGGPATYSEILSRELPARGIETEVLSFGQVRHLPKIARHIAYAARVWSRARTADLVYAQDPVSTGLPALIGARLARRRFLLKIVGDYAWEQGVQRWGVNDRLDEFVRKREGYPLPVRLLKRVERFVACRAEIVVVPSKYLKSVVAAWGVPEERIRVIYNSFEPPVLSGNRSVLRELIDFKGPLIVSVGRLVPWKGFTALIKLMPRVRERVPGAKLFIVGTGPQQDELERLVDELDLDDAVIFGGSVEHEVLMRYLETGDLFVLNTRYEGFSHVLLEAMAVGTPVVTTPVGGNTEIVKDGQNGLLVSPDDADALIAAIADALTDASMRQRLITGGRKTVGSFSIDRMVSELIPVLEGGL